MKKVVFYILALPMVLGIMAACEGKKTDAKNLEGRWTIVEVTGDSVRTTNQAFMEFNMSEMRLHGNAGCNTFNSTIKLDNDDASKITIAPGMSTMMACPDLDTENKILKAIESVDYVKSNNNANEMLLTDKSGKVLFVLRK